MFKSVSRQAGLAGLLLVLLLPFAITFALLLSEVDGGVRVAQNARQNLGYHRELRRLLEHALEFQNVMQPRGVDVTRARADSERLQLVIGTDLETIDGMAQRCFQPINGVSPKPRGCEFGNKAMRRRAMRLPVILRNESQFWSGKAASRRRFSPLMTKRMPRLTPCRTWFRKPPGKLQN